MIYVLLVILGLAGGSFVNAAVWRLHMQGQKGSTGKKMSILQGRSMCPNCRHELKALDLIPIASWLYLRGKCRYCGAKIDDNPLVELALPLIFLGLYVWWPSNLHGGGPKLLLATWLAASVGLLALLVYDAKWMLLPNRIIYPTLAVAAAGRLSYIFIYSNDISRDLLKLALSLAVASGFFWLLFEISKGKWIGFGDVRLGLITGSLLGDSKLSLLMIFGASVIGLASVVLGLVGNIRSLGTKIPFGPYLIIAAWLAVLFGQRLIDWYQGLLG